MSTHYISVSPVPDNLNTTSVPRRPLPDPAREYDPYTIQQFSMSRQHSNSPTSYGIHQRSRSPNPHPTYIPAQPQATISSRPSSPLIPTQSNASPPKSTSMGTAASNSRSQRREPWLLFAVALATATFAVTAWFAQATFSRSSSPRARDFIKSVFRVDIRDTLTILALLSGFLAFLLGFVVDSVLDTIQWILICRPDGVETLSVLAISATTSVLGTFGLLMDSYTPTSARIWGAGKIALRLFVWFVNIVLFLNTSLTTIYRPQFTYDALAGVGPFDGDLVAPYLRDLNLRAAITETAIPYSVSALAHNLVVNPQHAISTDHSTCYNSTCDSYTLPGGLATASPFPPTNLTEFPIITLPNLPATRVDFIRGIHPKDTILTAADCSLFAQDPYMIALRFCLAPSTLYPGSVLAAIYVCDLGTNHTTNECLTSTGTPPTINTTFSLARLTTTPVVSRANYSILSLTRPATDPVPDHSLNLTAYRESLVWLLNNTAADIPAPSAIIEYFWSAPLQLSNDYWSPGPRQAFQSLLAYPLWFFQKNNMGNVELNYAQNNSDIIAILSDTNTTSDGSSSPSNIYTTIASVSEPMTRIVINQGMFIVFVILVSIVLACGWLVVALLWVGVGSGKSSPLGTKHATSGDVRVLKVSSYPIVELGLRTLPVGGGPAGTTTTAPPTPLLRNPVIADDKAVREAVRDQRIVFRGHIEPALPFGVWFKGLFRRGGKKQNSNVATPSTSPTTPMTTTTTVGFSKS